jgi:hypothetical protein
MPQGHSHETTELKLLFLSERVKLETGNRKLVLQFAVEAARIHAAHWDFAKLRFN